MINIDHEYAGRLIAGIDEAGRGPLAGPVVAAAVIARDGAEIAGIMDSKKISAKKREELYELITAQYDWGVGIVEPQIIDEINILQATIKACVLAENQLKARAEIVLVDGNMKFQDARFKSIVKGDTKSHSIAAASIIAKVTRDRIMDQLHEEWPQYNWLKNKGYGSQVHIDAILQHGRSPHHRVSFKVRGM